MKGLDNPRVLVRMMKKSGHIVKETKLERGGDWGPQHVYVIRLLSEVLGVECDLEEY